MSFSTLYFDLDDTLYSHENGLWAAIRNRMGLYMAEKLGLPQDQIPEIRRVYYQTYGTTLRGLQKHHQVDADDYLQYVHDLPLESYIQPNPALRQMLLGLPQRRFIFTNADDAHAWRVMEVLGVSDCFEDVIDVRKIEFACKPESIAYQRLLALTNNPDPHCCVMLDDSPSNLAAARQIGFTTVLVGADGPADGQDGVSIPDILRLPHALPELWQVDPAQPCQGNSDRDLSHDQ